MSKKLTVAVVGATGAVGREMLKTLHDRQFPATEVRAFASARSAGTKVPFGDDELVVQELKEDVFEGIDIAIFSAGAALPKNSLPMPPMPAVWWWTTPPSGAWTTAAPWSSPK